MLIIFNDTAVINLQNLNNGTGTVTTKTETINNIKAATVILPKGASIGNHKHKDSCEIVYTVSGIGVAVCDSGEETLSQGVGHYCAVGDSHSIINTGNKDLVLFVVEVDDGYSSL